MILLVNDDGINAPGLRMLYAALRRVCECPVLAVAPAREQSGQSQAITIHRGLRVEPVHEDDFFGFAVDGTPTDCAKLALSALCPQKPQLVVSGINHGPNVGRSIFYSGTVGAALESAVMGYPALACSMDVGHSDETLAHGAQLAADIAHACHNRRYLRGQLINLNLPARPPAEWLPLFHCQHGHAGFDEQYRLERNGDQLSWRLEGEWKPNTEATMDDSAALSAGHPTISQLQPNLNNPDGLSPRLINRLNSRLEQPLASQPPNE